MEDVTLTCRDHEDDLALPDVVRRVLRGDWPAVLRGPEIVDVVILIECGMYAPDFAMWREDEVENRTWEQYLDRRYVARLETLKVADVHAGEWGCAQREHAVYFSTLTTRAPPILIDAGVLMDGNHRLEAAGIRGEAEILAYVVSRE